MRLLVVIALLALSGFASAQIESRLVNLRTDHFNLLDRSSFDARYFVNSEHFLAGGPIFIYVGNGLEIYDDFLTRGAVFEIAQDTRGHLFTLEHRYFGESRPTPDTSVQNLRFLTVDQALADLAQFINFIKANYYETANSRVILWGRGYGGSLAVWARQKYPNLVDGVWASSAPLNAVIEFPGLMANTFRTINNIGGPECGDILSDAFRMIENAIRLRNTSYVEERLNLCGPIDVDIEEDLSRLYYGIAEDIALNFVSNARYPEIDEKCIVMRGLDNPENLPTNAIDAFARWYVDEFNRNQSCIEFSNANFINRFSVVEWDTNATIEGRRQRMWLQCTQLGQFGVSNNGDDHPFGWRFEADFFRRWCAQIFDEEILTPDFIDASILRTNNVFGGLRPHVYRVFLTHGEMDPQRTLGPQEDLNANSPVVVMSLQSAGRDFGSPSETDYVVLQQTKEQARELIIQWIVDSAIEQPTDPTTIDPEDTTTIGPDPA